MSAVYEFEAEIIRLFQSVSTPFLDIIGTAVTFLGEQYLIVIPAALILWCFNKDLGKWMCYSLASASTFMVGLKAVVKVPRPIGWEGIRTLRPETATGYSFPSAHTGQCSSFWTSLAVWLGKKWWVLAFAVPALVGLSRIYLGCHWPSDVIGGFVIGTLVSIILKYLYDRFEKQRCALRFITCVVFLPFVLAGGFMTDFWKTEGLLIGLSAAFMLEEKFLSFTTDGLGMRRILLRAISGLAITLIPYLVMKLVFPEEDVFYFIRYFTLSFCMCFVSPFAFEKFRI